MWSLNNYFAADRSSGVLSEITRQQIWNEESGASFHSVSFVCWAAVGCYGFEYKWALELMRQNKRSTGATCAGQNIASIFGVFTKCWLPVLWGYQSRNFCVLCLSDSSFYPEPKPAITGDVASAVTWSLTLPESQGNAVQKAAEQHPEGVWSHSESLPPKFKTAKVVNLLTIKLFWREECCLQPASWDLGQLFSVPQL